MKQSRKGKGTAYGSKVRNAAAAVADTQAWMLKASAGGTRPCVSVTRCSDGDQVIRFGLDPIEERECPHCASIGIDSTLFVERVQEGLEGGGRVFGHCDGCYKRGVKLREIKYWEES